VQLILLPLLLSLPSLMPQQRMLLPPLAAAATTAEWRCAA
jgi:hypothetical protein